jgi:transposase
MEYRRFQKLARTNPRALYDLFCSLEERVARMEAILSKDSSNSGKPPSTDIVRKPVSLRKRTGRRSGGQQGHFGATLRLAKHPDKIIIHTAPSECCCGRDLTDIAATVERRQVFDIPAVKPTITEHRLEKKRCPDCGTLAAASAPSDVVQPVQYGIQVRTLVVCLVHQHCVPMKRTADFCREFFGIPISTGSVQNILVWWHERLAPCEAVLRQKLLSISTLHADETGCYIDGARWWIHAISSEQYALFFVHENRGRKAIDAMNILPAYTGTVVHDDWKPYDGYGNAHGRCNVHHGRELKFGTEEEHRRWTIFMYALLFRIKGAVEQAKLRGRHALSKRMQRYYIRRYRTIVTNGKKEYAIIKRVRGRRGRVKQTASKNLLDRFLFYEADILRFMTDFTVPFDNNLVERDLRMIKVKQKVSGCFRSLEGAEIFARIRSVMVSLRKKGMNVASSLRKIGGHTVEIAL